MARAGRKMGRSYGTQPMKTSDLAILADGIDGFFTEREKKISAIRVIGNGLKFRRGRIFGAWKIQVSTKERDIQDGN